MGNRQSKLRKLDPQCINQGVRGSHHITEPNHPDHQYVNHEAHGSHHIVEPNDLEPQISIHGGLHGSRHVVGTVYGGVHYGSKEGILELLRPDVVFDALYNSAKRKVEHAVTCQPETRTKVLSEIRSWADNTTTPICWLSGPAGTGKTTVAHTIAKEYNDRGQLAATFFFWRKTGDRDKINKLVPTLAYQIAKKIPSVKQQFEVALNVELPFSSLALQDQLENVLVLDPNMNDKLADYKLVVIDGLDECDDRDLIIDLIEWLRTNTFPFRIFMTSRPEPHITESFHIPLDGGISDTLSLSLTESKEDIRRYFFKHLRTIKHKRLALPGQSNWPLDSDVDQLVEKSEGLFIYAATAVRYISGEGSPVSRLESILRLHTGLDPLYDQVIQEALVWDYFDITMGSIIYLRERLSINEIAAIQITEGGHPTTHDIRMALHGCHSILVIPEDDDAEIRFHHASLRDFLTNHIRSRNLSCDPAKYHARLMVGCLVGITKAMSAGGKAPNYALESWHFHACSFLSSINTEEVSQDLHDRITDLVDKIDKGWVESWLMKAFDQECFPSSTENYSDEKKVKTYSNQTSSLERKTRIISKILENPDVKFTTEFEELKKVLQRSIEEHWIQV